MSKFDAVYKRIEEQLPVGQQPNNNNAQAAAPDPKQIAELIKKTFGVDVDHNALAKILPQQQQVNNPNAVKQQNTILQQKPVQGTAQQPAV